ncbi:hypothetical protein LP420_17855 [Massilia sp. B-10]|nr:hypothetical protein LP420_17855 [Massilia sp. B-10]
MSKSYWSGEAGDPRAWFDADARSAVTLLSADASPDKIAALRRDYEAAERTAFWHATLVSIAFWVSSIIALLVLMFSVYMYFRRLRGAGVPLGASGNSAAGGGPRRCDGGRHAFRAILAWRAAGAMGTGTTGGGRRGLRAQEGAEKRGGFI